MYKDLGLLVFGGCMGCIRDGGELSIFMLMALKGEQWMKRRAKDVKKLGVL